MSIDAIAEAAVRAARGIGKQVEDRIACRLATLKEGFEKEIERLQERQAALASDHDRGIAVLDANVVNLAEAREELQRRSAAEARLDTEIAALRDAVARLPSEIPSYSQPLADLRVALADSHRHFETALSRLADAERAAAERIDAIAEGQGKDREELPERLHRLAVNLDEDLAQCRREIDDRIDALADSHRHFETALSRLADAERAAAERIDAIAEGQGKDREELPERLHRLAVNLDENLAQSHREIDDRIDALAERVEVLTERSRGAETAGLAEATLAKEIEGLREGLGRAFTAVEAVTLTLSETAGSLRRLDDADAGFAQTISAIEAQIAPLDEIRSRFVPRETFDEALAEAGNSLAAGLAVERSRTEAAIADLAAGAGEDAAARTARVNEALADLEHRLCALVNEQLAAEELRRSDGDACCLDHIGKTVAELVARQEEFAKALASITLTPGPAGKDGYLPAVIPWRPRLHETGEVVSHLGGTWQARRSSDEPPGPASNAWELLTAGLATAEVTEEGRLLLTLSDGSARDAGLVRGPQGEGYRDRGQWRDGSEYAIGDVVTQNGSAWCALADGTLAEPPGPAWRLMVQRGQRGSRGPRGLDAAPAAVAEHLLTLVLAKVLPQIEEKALARIELVAERIAGEGRDRGSGS